MMQLEEFVNTVLAAVREKADGAFSAWITTVTKNNGIKHTGISTIRPDSNNGPCVYLDDYYKAYRQGSMQVDTVAEDVYQQIMKHRDDLKDINIADFLQWDVMKRHIYAKLINADMNREELGTVPHRLFLDLAVVYYIKIDGAEEDGMMSIIIRNQYMKMWGQDEESLYQMAVVNRHLKGKPFFEDMETMLKGIIPEETSSFGCEAAGVKMYVLTNRNRTFGAVEILDANTLWSISEKLADDFIVLPSSVHETLIIPSDKAPEYMELADMVCEVNTTQVNMEERLSNHVYRYDRNEGVLKIVA